MLIDNTDMRVAGYYIDLTVRTITPGNVSIAHMRY